MKQLAIEIKIRKYNTADRENCLLAFMSNVPEFFTESEIKQFENWLDNLHNEAINGKTFHSSYYYVVSLDEIFIGCGGFGYNNENNVATLAWGLINTIYHKRGFGKELLVFRLQQIRLLYPTANVLIDTTQYSFPFFEKYGFTTEKITTDFYAVGMDRYDMILKP